jgi:hypothetical protein
MSRALTSQEVMGQYKGKVMTDKIQLKEKTWYETRGGDRVYCIGKGVIDSHDPCVVQHESGGFWEYEENGVFNINNMGTDNDIVREIPDPTKKRIEPKYKVWRSALLTEGLIDTVLFVDLECARNYVKDNQHIKFLAITPADAQSFFEGEGLEDE